MSDSVSGQRMRLPELDYVKALCILGMVCVHCFERFVLMEDYANVPTDLHGINAVIGFLSDCIGGFAPLFMICLGVGIIYSRRSTFGHLMKRGLLILLVAMLLRFFVDFLPLFVTGVMSGNWNPDILGFLLEPDILNFAALTFIFFALVKKFRLNNWVVFIIGLGLLVSALFVSKTIFDNQVASYLFGWFYWQANKFSFFPFCQWIIYPVAGYLFGQILVKITERRRFYKNILIASLLGFPTLLISYSFAGINLHSIVTTAEGATYNTTPWSALFFLFLGALFLSALFFAAEATRDTVVAKITGKASRNITIMYVLQWVIISWIYHPVLATGILPFTYPVTLLIGIVIFIIVYVIADKGFAGLKKKRAAMK